MPDLTSQGLAAQGLRVDPKAGSSPATWSLSFATAVVSYSRCGEFRSRCQLFIRLTGSLLNALLLSG